MQVTETEIILPFNANRNIPLSRRDILSLCIAGIFMLGGGIFLLIPHGGLIPITNESPLSILLIILSILILLPSTALLAMSLQGESMHSPRFVRIDHEGIFFSYLLPTVVKWSEISMLTPYTTRTYLGSRSVALGIAPQDPENILARITDKRSMNFLSHFLMKADLYFYHRSNKPSPLILPQMLLPISIDELIAMIQERFANELREHHVVVSGWQDETG